MSKRKKTNRKPPRRRDVENRDSGSQHISSKDFQGRSESPNCLYGIHAVLAVLSNRERKPKRLLVTSEALKNQQVKIDAALAIGEHEGIQPEIVDRHELETLLPVGALHQGMVVQAPPLRQMELEDILEQGETNSRATLVVLDQATDPHNIGAVVRSAAAFGAIAVIVPDRHTPDITGVMAKSASGALEKVALVRVANLARAMEKMKAAGFWCIGMDGHASQMITDADLSGRVALLLGAEGSGLRRLTRENCDVLVKVPISDTVESLNLSNAAAIALYERNRQISKV